MALLTFAYPSKLLDLKYHDLKCSELVQDNFRKSNGFDCSFVSGNKDQLGVFALQKSEIGSPILLQLFRISQLGLILEVWIVTLIVLIIWLVLAAGRSVRTCAPALLKCLWRTLIVVTFGISLAGLCWLLQRYPRTHAYYDKLQDGLCKLRSADARVAPPLSDVYSVPSLGHSFRAPQLETPWSVLPSVSCLVNLEIEGVKSPSAFSDGDKLTLLTFDFPERLSDPSFHQLQCSKMADQLYSKSKASFPCTYVPGNPGGWGVFASSKEKYSNLVLLTLTQASMFGLPFLIWTVSLGLLVVVMAMTLLRALLCRCCCALGTSLPDNANDPLGYHVLPGELPKVKKVNFS
eukprot:TRINITY_DN97354_c0_g1_i1.p1 TRINITY_DN97354_c0_g1~~TRINITY_DN97354_c0_g1_i1.p1  ORF type:complete len:384 (-),score=24.07 TRINITY_DN97354_c0_g1_i1:148-1191(-)